LAARRAPPEAYHAHALERIPARDCTIRVVCRRRSIPKWRLTMARKVFYVCAGMLMLALSYHLGAGRATAGAGLALPTEVVTLSGVLQNGETIPLPMYADGTVASEAECDWIVSDALGSPTSVRSWCYAADAVYNTYFPITFLTAHRGRVVNIAPTGQSNSIETYANYLIIATRSTGPTPAHQETWGRLKARYAPGR
jgi:hypothetical protein